MSKEEFDRINAREELKKISKIMLDLLQRLYKIKKSKISNSATSSQLKEINDFFMALTLNVNEATKIIGDDIFQKGLYTYRFINRYFAKDKNKAYLALKTIRHEYKEKETVWRSEILN